MTVELDIKSLLSPLVNDRVYPLTAPQDSPRPYITYQVVSNPTLNHLEGDVGVSQRRFQIEAWADSYGAAKTLAKAIKDAMNGAGHLRLGDIPDKYDPDTQTYASGADYSVWGDS